MTGKATKLLEAIPAEGVGKDGKPRTLPSDRRAVERRRGRRSSSSAENDLWVYELGAKAARRITQRRGRGGAAALLPRRGEGRLREGERPLVRRGRLREGDAPDDGREPDRPQREARLGLRGGARGAQRRPGLRVGARLLRHRLPPPRPVARPGVPDRRLPPDERKAPAPALPEAGRPERHALGPRRRRGPPAGRSATTAPSRFDGDDVLVGPDLSWTPDGVRRRLHEDEPDADGARGVPPSPREGAPRRGAS